MSGSEHKAKTKCFKAEEMAVRRILNEWSPIPGSPEDEYDCLVHHILAGLHRGARQSDLVQLIKTQMQEHFGIEEPDGNITQVAEKISLWWESTPKRG